MWHMHDGWGWWMVVGWVWMVVFWGLIVWAVYAVVTRLERTPPDQTARHADTPLTILERRYARGELTTEQFEAMRSLLTTGGGPPAQAA
jgi:putative membrane protein